MKTRLGCVCMAMCLQVALGSLAFAQIIFTNVSVADAFVRSLAPTSNYGGAGALSVSGTIATNAVGQQEGLLDSFMRFDVSGPVSNLNHAFGVGQWVIVRVTLNLFEQGAPNNATFNRGVGLFEVRWIADNSWAEGTGNPNAPTTDGIVWNDEPSVLNPNLDVSLGTFVNGGTDGLVRLMLTVPPGFVDNVSTGALVSFYVTAATNSPVGFTFHSHNFVDPTQWPFLEVTAVPIPQITSLAIIGSNAKIIFSTATNLTYAVEYSNDLVGGSWDTLANVTGNGGPMSAIDFGVAAMAKRFYRVHLLVSP
ncbi:MAG TPA: hypothetical protein VL171_12520 [Verrucomicrobiae bacterium]|nr:hypothetical protein [Verrucomicrobiae bacterium]